MSSYYLRSDRPYTEKDGRLSFSLRGINSELTLNKALPGNWVKIPMIGSFLDGVMGGSGVYAISIRNNKTKKEDVCYIGSSKSIPVRLYSHDIISFLTFYLSTDFSIDLFVIYVENFKSMESKLISTVMPFLNYRKPEVRKFDISKKNYINKLKHK